MIDRLLQLREEILAAHARLVAVSKTRTPEQIMEIYDQGQRDFGENYVQEMCSKHDLLPGDIRWHFIGHLQSNKVRHIASFVHTIHAMDSLKLLGEVERQAAHYNREICCLLQVHIAREQTKFGMNAEELDRVGEEVARQADSCKHAPVTGLMGMATHTDDTEQIRMEFRHLHALFESLQQSHIRQLPRFKELSMGMSADYRIALEEGATLIRIGSLVFGPR